MSEDFEWQYGGLFMTERWTLWKQLKMFFKGGRLHLSNGRVMGAVSADIDIPKWTWIPKARSYALDLKYEAGEHILNGVISE